MPQATTLVDALKRVLKARAITYGDLAGRINMSEASVKRMFSQKNFTLQRLDEILLASGIDFDELTEAAHHAPTLISSLSLAQERDIIGDPRLLVVAVSVMNHIDFATIVRIYHLNEAEAVSCLLRLDKIGFLELLPNNRVKLLISRTFGWIANGPIQTWFRDQAAGDYLASRFDGELERMRLVNVMLSRQSIASLLERMSQLASEFAQQHQQDAKLPFEQKHALSLMLAARPWLPQAFKTLIRHPS